MNKGLLALNIILLLAVGVLFFLVFDKKDAGYDSGRMPHQPDTAPQWQHTPVAYFDMDSVEANFTLFRQMQEEVIKREQVKNDSINYLRGYFQNYVQKLQPQFDRLNPREKDSVNTLLSQMDNDIKNRIGDLNQNYQTYYVGKQQEIITQIKNYCKEFNKDRKYSYIIAREPGLFYYTDTAYNVTAELLKGLNAFYNKKKN